MRRFVCLCFLFLCCFGGCALGVALPRASAATFTVTNLQDKDTDDFYGCTAANVGDGCTLREAILARASTNDTQTDVVFAPGLSGTISLVEELPYIVSPLSIKNTTGNKITISRGSTDQYRIFSTTDNFALEGLTIANGLGAGGGALYANGSSRTGGITVSVNNCTFLNNSSPSQGGGAIDNNISSNLTLNGCTFTGNTSSIGACISNTGNLTLNSCTLSGNTATKYAGGLFLGRGIINVNNCTIAGNTAPAGKGSGVVSAFSVNINGTFTYPYIVLSNTIVAANTNSDMDLFDSKNSFVSGGYNLLGTSDTNALAPFSAAQGDQLGVTAAQLQLGALADNGGPTLTRAIPKTSIAYNAGNPSTAYSPTAFDQRGTPYRRVAAGRVDAGAYEYTEPFTTSLVVTTLADEDNSTTDPQYGTGTSLREAINYANSNADQSDISFKSGLTGTISLTTALPSLATNLSIQNPTQSTIALSRTGSTSFRILTVTGGTSTLRGLTLTGGYTPSNTTGTTDKYGGGIFNSASSTLIVRDCTFRSNHALISGGGLCNAGTLTMNNCTFDTNVADGSGGGFYTYGPSAVNNCTLSGNTAASNGGGFYNTTKALTLNSCTISGNTAQISGGGGGFFNASSGTLTLGNSIVVGNTGSFDATNSATFVSAGSNLLGNTSISAALLASTDTKGVTTTQLKLGSLASNGGPTQTRALQPGSIAINVGNTDLTTDQRGVFRPQSSGDDVGAYEFTFNESLVVTTLADENDGTSDPSFGTGTSLREAINYANSNADQSDITFKSGLTGTISLLSALPDLKTNLTIKNQGAPSSLVIARNVATGTPQFSVLTVTSAGVVTLQGLTLSGGNTSTGGGLYNGGQITLNQCVLSGNQASGGGGLYNPGGASATLNQCTLRDNSASTGGAMLMAGNVSLNGCTLSGNTASNNGAGIVNDEGTLVVSQCTLSGNTTTGNGGGLLNFGTATVTSSTLAGNAAPNGGGFYNGGSTGALTLSNSIVAANTISTTDSTPSDAFNNKTVTSGGYNLIGALGGTVTTSPFTQSGDQTGITANQLKLGDLADNGGPTQTRAITKNSTAVNAGDPGIVASSTAYDQRGAAYLRVVGGRSDVGAYEFQGPFNESLVVTTLSAEDNGTSDPALGDGTSLAEAINYANSNPDQSDITFDPALAGSTFVLPRALPALSTPLSIKNTFATPLTLMRSDAAGTPDFVVLSITASGKVDLLGLTVTNGSGSGISNLGTATLTNCILTGNNRLGASNGGGFYNSGTATMTNCTLTSNTAVQGGGFYNIGSATLTGCTLSGNSSITLGGGVFNGGTMAMKNCTFTANRSTNGGAIHNNESLIALNCTLVRNVSSADNSERAGGISTYGGTTPLTTLSNCIVAGNTQSDLFHDANGRYISNGYNLLGTGTIESFTQSGDRTGITESQLKLGDLANNGGLTQTIALLAGSIAINAGDTALTIDQRGIARPQGSRDDVGAYEFDGAFAESLTVTTLSDEDDGTSDPAYGKGTSLREAVNYANGNADQSDITFADGLASGTLTLTSALPNLRTDLRILNPATATITIGRSTVTGTPQFSVLAVQEGTVTLQGLTLTNGSATSGGGLNNSGTVTLINCALNGNGASINGGGLANSGTATLDTCILSGNVASFNGGGLYTSGSGVTTLTRSTLRGNTANQGGGLYNEATSVTLRDCTLSGNSATTLGGGLMNGVSLSTLSATNCTLNGNAAGGGGAFYNNAGTATFNNCTVSGNTSAQGVGGLANAGALTLGNSLSVGNTSFDVYSPSASGGTSTLTSKGYNMVGQTNASTLNQAGDQISVTPLQANLGPLQDNGGFTQTIALLPGSLAVNAGNPDVTGLPDSDQRGTGYARVRGARVDVGAYESSLVTLKGVVYNATALIGMSGIRVQALASNGTVVAQTLTGSTGTYRLDLVPGSYTLVATNPNNASFRFTPSFTNPVAIADAGTGTLSYNFRSVGIGGRIISPANAGIKGVTLTLTAQGSSTPTATTVSDAQGFFSFDGLAAGTWIVAPTAPNTYAYTPTSRTFALSDKAVFTSFTAANKIVYAISGKVTILRMGQSLGLAGVTLKATRQSDGATFAAVTGSDGSYALSNLTIGTYTLAPQNAGFTYTYAPTPNQTQPVVLTASTPAKSGQNFVAKPLLSGRVYNAVGLAGLSGMVVKAVRSSDGAVFAATTNSEGRYSLSLDPGTYTLSAFFPHKDGFIINPAFANPVTVAATVPASVPSYDFRALGVTGRVVTSSNVGVSGVTVNLYAQNDTTFKTALRTAVTDSNGFFSLDGVAAGTWVVVPVAPTTYSYTPASRLVTVVDKAVFISFTTKAKSGTKSVLPKSPVVLSSASADSKTATLTLTFTGQVDEDSAQNLAHYSVMLLGHGNDFGGEDDIVEVKVQEAHLHNGNTLVITLPEGSIPAGSHLAFAWHDLLDAQGLIMQSQTALNVP